MSPTSDSARPSRSDGEATRQRILDVAGEMIGAAGFADTANKAIAARAEVDLASINYHFGTRAGLYQAVLAEAHRRVADRSDLERIVAAPGSAEARLKTLLRFFLGGHGDGNGDGQSGGIQWPILVLGREVLTPTPHFATLQQQEILPKLQIILPMLSEISGIPLGDPALFRCLPSIAAPCAMLALVGRSATPMARQFCAAPLEEIVEQMFTFALGGLAAVGAWHRAGKPLPGAAP